MKLSGLSCAALIMSVLAAALAGCATDRVSPKKEAAAHYSMGISRMESGNDEAALYEFGRAIEKDPYNADAHFAASVVYIKQSNFDAAIKELKKTLSINPNLPDAHNNLGLAYARKKEFEAAIKEFKAASEFPMSGSQSDALRNMGVTYELMGKQDEAGQAYREALLTQPDDDQSMVRLAALCVKMDKAEEAIKLYEKSLQISPDNAQARYELGMVYFKLGRQPEALVNFQKVILLVPGSDVAAGAKKYMDLIK